MSAADPSWGPLLGACALGFAVKLSGHLIPARVLERPAIARTAGLVTVGLLAALVAVQTVTSGQALVADARMAGLAVAAVALALRAPFLVVVVLAAGTAAALRALT